MQRLVFNVSQEANPPTLKAKISASGDTGGHSNWGTEPNGLPPKADMAEMREENRRDCLKRGRNMITTKTWVTHAGGIVPDGAGAWLVRRALEARRGQAQLECGRG